MTWSSPSPNPDSNSKAWQRFNQSLDNYRFTAEFIEVLWRRGYKDASQVAALLSNDSETVFNSYKLLHDAETAAKLIRNAVEKSYPITIYGDYDADGITSTSLLWRFLYRDLKADAQPFIPHRGKEGYGLNLDKCIELLDSRGRSDIPQLLIAVDCGVRDVEIIASLKAKYPALIIIIADHHSLRASASKQIELPAADAIIHPHLPHPDLLQSSINPANICACAVAWNLICACRDLLGIPQTPEGLELVAIGTVCDLMPLTGWNRLLVKTGLKQLQNTRSMGIQALARASSLDLQNVKSYHLGFVIGPRLNAAGRLGDAIDAVRLLCTESAVTALNFANQLNRQNQQRQELTSSATASAKNFRSQQSSSYTNSDATNKEATFGLCSKSLNFIANAGWQEGIIGLIAGKLQELSGLPTIILSQNQHGQWVGSARSPKTVNITAILNASTQLLERFGGHAQAAGLTVKTDNLESLAKALNQTLSQTEMTSESAVLSPLMHMDFSSANLQFAQELDLLEPFGFENSEPEFLFNDVNFQQFRQFGNNHNHLGLNSDLNPSADVVWFNHSLTSLSALQWPLTTDFVSTVGINTWNNRQKLQLKIRALNARI